MLKHKPIVLFLQETKLDSFDSGIIRSLGGDFLSRGIGSDAEGASGGLITLWNESQFSVNSCISLKRCIILEGELLRLKKQLVLCNVYAANSETERKELWEYILNVQSSSSFPWCIGGDFNTILDPSERIGAGCDMSSIQNFNSFVLRAKVVDLPLQYISFTWSNNRDKASWARLDRFLISTEILTWFPDMVQVGISRSLSDHSAIMIGEKVEDWGPTPFRFFNDWLEEKDLMKVAVKGWKGCKVSGTKSVSLAAKLKGAKCCMKKWLISYKKVPSTCTDIEVCMAAVDSKANVIGWTESLRKERLVLLSKLWLEIRREEQLWRQKSRARWLKEGDRNSKFFHVMANGKKRRNRISVISFGGVKMSDPIQVKNGVVDFF
ncbi:hypothetical protein Ddye_018106 [Dipteronia dyeriana]|uniref:Endonuclease/exonuclease/phosphatase domain-containing protein n=1 Tax=Dipteronia dyeriana TaxID=168575 RepID=A0AAD9UA23_9ROSI|nr:hypothetical protein Ddye_018106 [Dipteronia dyeriana]